MMKKHKLLKNFTLAPEWPSGLPKRCENCDNAYDARFSLEVGPGRLGRWLRKSAPWMSMVMVLILFGTGLSFLELGGNGAAMAFAAIIVVPSLIMYVLGGLLPTRFRLYCHKCRHTEFLPVSETWDNRISTVTE